MADKEAEYRAIRQLVGESLKDCRLIEFEEQAWSPSSRFSSNSLGSPYFEKGESWPRSPDTGREMKFLFQFVNDGKAGLPGDIGALQLFVDADKRPSSHADDGWLVKTYGSLDREKSVAIEEEGKSPRMALWECSREAKCAPSWEDVPGKIVEGVLAFEERYGEEDVYSQICSELGAEHAMSSKIFGYPGWYQGKNPDLAELERRSDFLLDVHTGIPWCWMGAIYLYLDRATREISYYHQYT